jgi:8-oxo-dGTP diphosphatase
MAREKINSNPLKFAILAVDVLLFSYREGKLVVRVQNVNRPPHFTNINGFPGGLISPDETAEQSAERIIREKGGVSAEKIYLEQLATFSRVDRDPRGRVVAVSYLGCVSWENLRESEKLDNERNNWILASRPGKLAYDHKEMLQVAINRLKAKVSYTTIVSKLLPREFTMTELENAIETIKGVDLDKRNFRKKTDKIGILKATGKVRSGNQARPARLYRFVNDKVVETDLH